MADKLTPEEEAEIQPSAEGGEETPETPSGEEAPETPEAEKPEEKKSKELQSAIAQKEHFRKKFETLKAERDTALGALGGGKETPKKPKTDIPTTDPMETVRLSKALEGYSEDEVEFIVKNASDKSIDSIIGASKDDWVQIAIKAKREKVGKDKAIPSPSSPLGSKSSDDAEKAIEEGKHKEWAEKREKEFEAKERGGVV